MNMNRIFLFLILGTVAVFAGGAIEGEVQKQALNVSAIVMFLLFVGGTLGITYWAASVQNLLKIFILQVVELLVFKMVWLSLVTICQLHLSLEFLVLYT